MLQQFFTDKQLDTITGVSRSERWRLIKAQKFPKPVKVGLNGKRNRWPAAEIERWQRERIAERDAGNRPSPRKAKA